MGYYFPPLRHRVSLVLLSLLLLLPLCLVFPTTATTRRTTTLTSVTNYRSNNINNNNNNAQALELENAFDLVNNNDDYHHRHAYIPKGNLTNPVEQFLREAFYRRRMENNGDDDGGGDDDDGNNNVYFDDDMSRANEECSQFLVSFLEGTSDARDTCEGIMNAYTAADCGKNDKEYSQESDNDEYFEDFYEHKCCQSLIRHHSDYCEEGALLTNLHLLIAASVLLLCECAKSIVKTFRLHFLPEAAVCILVGTAIGLISQLIPGANIDDIVFDETLFMSVLLPPIIFEAALSVSKKEFRRRRGAIFMFAVFGTVISTFASGLMVHYVSSWSNSMTFPVLDSLVFGALISSIDPVAILSVLSSLRMSETDTVFILVFGESLLNDGIAITTFKTLVERFDGKTNIGTFSLDEILDAMANFLLNMFCAVAIGLACGFGAYVYFSLLDKKMDPVMEVGSFFIWALVPYYVCEAFEWSGIVSIVVMGFIMDIYIASPKQRKGKRPDTVQRSNSRYLGYSNDDRAAMDGTTVKVASTDDEELHGGLGKRNTSQILPLDEQQESSAFQDGHFYNCMSDENLGFEERTVDASEKCGSEQSMQPLHNTDRLRLSSKADKHVRFVAHLTASLSENAIFAYLGLFLLSNNYDWDPSLVTIAIISCVVSRLLMVVVVSFIIVQLNKWRMANSANEFMSGNVEMSRTATAIQDKRTQMVLVLAGLRGAVSLALVESVPIYNAVTGEGCEFKPLMKGMASGSIIFTMFVFGGGAYYVLPHLGIKPENETTAKSPTSMVEMETPVRRTVPLDPGTIPDGLAVPALT